MPSHDANPALAYLRTRVLSASPMELRLLLLDGAVRFARQGQEGLEQRNYEASHSGITQCRNILIELATNVQRDADPDLCDRVRALYLFLYNELINANLEKSAARVAKVVEILEYERETWALLMKKVQADGHGPAVRPDVAPAATAPARSISLSA